MDVSTSYGVPICLAGLIFRELGEALLGSRVRRSLGWPCTWYGVLNGCRSIYEDRCLVENHRRIRWVRELL